MGQPKTLDKQIKALEGGFRWEAQERYEEQALAGETEVHDWIEAGAPSPMEMWRDSKGAPSLPQAPLTVKQAATRENVSERTIYRWIERGEVEAWKIGKLQWRIGDASLDAHRKRPRRRRQSVSAADVAPSGVTSLNVV